MGRCPIKPKASPFELRECRHRGARNLLEAHHHTTAAGNKPSLRARSSAAVISSGKSGEAVNHSACCAHSYRSGRCR